MADYTFFAFYTAEGAAKSGLTVTVDVVNSAGAAQVTGASASAVAGGFYKYNYSTATEDNYLATFKTTDTTVDAQHIPSMVAKEQPKINVVATVVDAIKTVVDTIKTNVDTLLTRLSSTRAGYLDKLNVAGTLANTNNADTFKADVTAVKLHAEQGGVEFDGGTIGTIDKKVSAFIDPDAFMVSGAGEYDVNGMYKRTGDYEYSLERNNDWILTRYSGAWYIQRVGGEPVYYTAASNAETVYYTAASNAETPDLVDNWELGAYGVLPLPKIAPATSMRLSDTQGAITWGQQKIIADVEEEGALHIENVNENGIGNANIGGAIGQYNYGAEAGQGNYSDMVGQYNYAEGDSGATRGQLNEAYGTNGYGQYNFANGNNSIGQKNEGDGINSNGQENIGEDKNVEGYDPAIVTAIEALVNAMKGTGWTDETLVALMTAIEAVTGGSGATPQQIWEYAARTLTAGTNIDLSSLATAADLQDVEDKIDVIATDTTTEIPATLATLATAAALDAVDNFIDTEVAAIKAKTDLIPASPAEAGEYTAAIAAIPTAPLLAANYTAPDNASIAAIKAKTDNLPADPADDSDIDAQLAAIKAETALIVEDTGTDIPATLAGLATSTEVSAIAMLDEVVIGTYTVQDILKILAAKTVGKATGGGTTTITYRGLDDTSNVIVETVDANGNRSAVTLTV